MTDASTRASPVYQAATRPRLTQRDRLGPPVVPAPDKRDWHPVVILALGFAMFVVGMGSVALLIWSVF